MYNPSSFQEQDRKTLFDLIHQHPLGLLISNGASGVMVSPIPFMVRDGLLVAHIAKANLHWKDLIDLKECLVIFQGQQAYVTPSWYPSKAKTHQVVPTWNYEIVEIRGKPEIFGDADWLKTQVTALTDHMESSRPDRWQVSDAPAHYIDKQLKGIVGLTITITQINGKWKMSQNRSLDDALGVAKGLSNPNDPHQNPCVAEIVKSRISD